MVLIYNITETMSSIQYYREFISERLSAAAEEIFSEFEKTITQYEEALHRQRRLLQVGWKAKPTSHTAGLLQQNLCNQLSKQSLDQPGTNLSLTLKRPEGTHHQNEPEPPQIPKDAEPVRIKQEQEELWTNQDELALSPQADTFEIQYESSCEETFMGKNVVQPEDEGQHKLLDSCQKPRVELYRIDDLQHPDCMEERNCSLDLDEPQPPQIKVDWGGPEPPQSQEEQEKVCSSQDEELVLKQEPGCFLVTLVHEESFPSEPNTEQSFSHCAPISESPVQEDNTQVGSELTASKTSVNNSSLLDGLCQSYTGKKTKKCGICRKIFKNKPAILNHLKTHTQKKLFSCEICGIKVRSSSDLEKHHTIHTEGSKPYTCTPCGKSFRQLTSLQLHENIHTAKKPFVCHICGKILRQRRIFTYHMKWHADNKPHYNIRSGKPFTPTSTPTDQKTS